MDHGQICGAPEQKHGAGEEVQPSEGFGQALVVARESAAAIAGERPAAALESWAAGLTARLASGAAALDLATVLGPQ